MSYWKILTHDLRPPIQGGNPIFAGTFPCDLQEVALDESKGDCAAGWNFVDSIATGFRIAGMWPDGWPAKVVEVEPVGKWVQRGDKYRTTRLRMLRFSTEEEIRAGIEELSAPFGEHRAVMVDEQLAWRRALGRPKRDEAVVEEGLRETLRARGLEWKLKRFASPWDARDARDAWAARAVWAAWAVWAARAARDVWAARAARDAWAAWDAWAALAVQYTARRGLISCAPDRHTVGIRDAYEHGLGIALPTGPQELGWAMAEAN